jgi:hypothetical protein
MAQLDGLKDEGESVMSAREDFRLSGLLAPRFDPFNFVGTSGVGFIDPDAGLLRKS